MLKSPLFQLLIQLSQMGLSEGMKMRQPRYITLKLIAVVAAVISSIFGLIALYSFLLLETNFVITNVIFMLIFIIVALVLLLVVHYRKQHYRSLSDRLVDKRKELLTEFISESSEYQEQAEHLLNEHKGKVLLAAAILGLVLGDRVGKSFRDK